MTSTTTLRLLTAATTAVSLLGLAALTGTEGPVRAARALATPAPSATTSTLDVLEPTGTPRRAHATASDRDALAAADAAAGDRASAAPRDQSDAPAPPDARAATDTGTATGAAETPAAEMGPAPWSVGVHSGLGAWVDVWDWTMWGSSGAPTFTMETIDALASQGVRTIYLQTTRIDKPEAVLEQDRLLALVDRAHEHGMFVVGWYLPTFTDVADDLHRIEAAMALPLDGFALDIESQDVADPAERTRRLLAMSQRLRELAGDRVLVANVLPPVQLEELAPSLWPGFPWAELGEYYEVFMPMGYFTFREDGHHWRDAEAYTTENVRRIRERVGDPELPVHFIGGIADLTTVEDVEGMTRGAQASGAIGLSLYDVATTGPELWTPMEAWRELR